MAADWRASVFMVEFMGMKKRVRVSKGGQVSLPAPIRKRWSTSTLVLDDQGDHVVLNPAPDDPIKAAAGALSDYFQGVDLANLRAERRAEEREAEEGSPGST